MFFNVLVFIRHYNVFWGYLNEESYYKTLSAVVTEQSRIIADLYVCFAPYVFLWIFSVSF